MSTSKTIAATIREAREKTGLTQEEFAKKAGLSTSGYIKIEIGTTKTPDATSINKLAKVLGVNPKKLIDLLG